MASTHLSRPRFSVVVPCYNDGALAIQAIQSCLSQRGEPDLEVLFVDDGSRDDSANKVAEAFTADERVRILRKPNGGLASARNHGLLHAHGSWLVYLDADDLLAPAYLQQAEAVILSSAIPLDVVVLPFRYVNEDGKHDARQLINSLLLAPRFTDWQGWNRFWIRVGNALPVSSMAVAASLSKRLGGFDESLRAHEDWEYWIRAIDQGARIRYAKAGAESATLITLRQGMSANRALMAETHGDVLRRHCSQAPLGLLKLRSVALLLLGFRTLLGMLDACVGRRVNLTFP